MTILPWCKCHNAARYQVAARMLCLSRQKCGLQYRESSIVAAIAACSKWNHFLLMNWCVLWAEFTFATR
jgi:hypothetical protein